MAKKSIKIIKIETDTDKTIFNIQKEMEKIEGKGLSRAEVVRRTFNIPSLPEVLLRDSEIKRMSRK